MQFKYLCLLVSVGGSGGVGVSSDVGVSGVAWCLVACLWLWLVL